MNSEHVCREARSTAQRARRVNLFTRSRSSNSEAGSAAFEPAGCSPAVPALMSTLPASPFSKGWLQIENEIQRADTNAIRFRDHRGIRDLLAKLPDHQPEIAALCGDQRLIGYNVHSH